MAQLFTANTISRGPTGLSGVQGQITELSTLVGEVQTTADGKATIVHQASTVIPQPIGTHLGDLWFQTNNDNAVFKWDLGGGGQWLPATLGDGAIAGLNVGKLVAGTMTANVTISGQYATSLNTNTARVVLNATGLHAYNASGVQTVNISSLGTAAFTGAITGSTITGSTVTGSLIRATGSGDTSLTSTSHGLQVGVTDSFNIAMDNNEIQARSNGLASNIGINWSGGSVTLGQYGYLGGGNNLQQRTVINDDQNRDTLYINTDFDNGFTGSAIRAAINEEIDLTSFSALSAYVAANNTPNTVFRLRGDGTGFAQVSWNGGGADFAELFQSADGTALPMGRAVTLAADGTVRLAGAGDPVLGVTSATPTVVGNSPSNWPQMHLQDPYGAYLLDPDGRRQVNPDYHPDLDEDGSPIYLTRDLRPEWNAIGLVGQVVVDDDGTATAGEYVWVKDATGSFTASDRGYLVITRVDASHVRVLVVPKEHS